MYQNIHWRSCKWLICYLPTALLLLTTGSERTQAAPCGGHGTAATMVVSAEWLSGHLQDRNLVLLAVGKEDEYSSGHVPGARYIDYADVHSSTPVPGSSALILELPAVDRLTELLARNGVTNESHIVLYSTKDNATVTARVYLTLDAMGLGASTSILDGGFPVWTASGRAISREVLPAASPGVLRLCPQKDVVATLDEVRSVVGKPKTVVVDARLSEYYTGEKIPQGRRAGHIPGATNIPFSSVLDESGRLLPAEALRQKFQAAGAKPGDRVISYCHIGQQASLVYFAARYLGYDASMFDGSWQEWSAHAELPADVSTAKTDEPRH